MTSIIPLAIFGLGGQELLIILAIVLLVFGASKLPQLGSGLGKSIKNFKKAMREEDDGGGGGEASTQAPKAVVQVAVQHPEQLEAKSTAPETVNEPAPTSEAKS